MNRSVIFPGLFFAIYFVVILAVVGYGLFCFTKISQALQEIARTLRGREDRKACQGKGSQAEA